ncbi:Fic/DOC family protein [bacterium JGI 053]|nr:Fic/DOC family protein [bacterium JGI 053]
MSDSDNTPRDAALRWWREHAEREEYVIGKDDFPAPAEGAFLRSGGYVLEVAGGAVWILARPGADVLPDAFYPNYWKIVRVLLAGYAPAAVERVSAVRLHLEESTPPPVLTVRQGGNGSKRAIELVPGFGLVLRPGEVDPALTVERRPSGVPIPVDDPAATLLALPVEFLRDDPELVALWLKSLVVSRPQLEEAYARRPRPVVLKRLGGIAREVGNTRLAEQIDEVLIGGYRHRIGRGHTERGPVFTVPAHVAGLATTHQPWLDRQAATFARFRAEIEEAVGEAESRLARFGRDALLVQAREAKAYDAYHSTTIEGYRIRPEEVSAVISGVMVGGHDPEEVRSRMAVAGYSKAFETTLATVRDAAGDVAITDALVQGLYIDLFSPSVDAGIVSPELLRGWRTEPAYLRGHLYVPPGPEKLPRLMRQYEELVNGVAGHPLARAILAHLEFVTVHPYPDGNGRLARLLMNVALLGGGLPWVTIRNDDRPPYFAALHAAQVEGDPLPFTRLVLRYAQAAAAAMEARAQD